MPQPMRGVPAISCMVLAAALAGSEPFQPSDMTAWRVIADPQISADGRRVVYVERWCDGAALAVRANLRWGTADGQQNTHLSDGPWEDRSPRWAPGGTRIAFLSDRNGGRGIHVTELSGAQSVISTGDYRPLSLAWSPDSRQIAFTARVVAREAAPWAPPALLRLLRPPQPEVELFVVSTGGEAERQITHGGFTLRGEPAWMPAGDSILNAAAGSWETSQVYAVRVGDGESRRLTEGPAANVEPLPSPDGARVAWIRTAAEPAFYAVAKPCVMGRDGGRRKVLAGQLERDARRLQWSSDSRTLYFLADDQGATHVYAARADGTARQVTNRQERLEGFSLADNGRAATVRSSGRTGGDLVTFVVDQPGGAVTLAEPNQPLIHQREFGTVEEIHFEAAGHSVQGWLIWPPKASRTGKMPLVVEASSEPGSMFGYECPLEAHILAAAGYAVLRINARGSPGYGEAFGNLLPTRLPGDDFDDVMRGVDAAVAGGGLDGKRLALIGGAVAAWALGHTNRFSAIVARHPIVDWTSEVALSDGGWRRAAWMGGMPWEQAERYVARSPLYAAGSFAAPTLLIGAGAQSEELYFALQARKVEAALLVPDPAAGTGGSAAEVSAILAWLKRWVKPAVLP